MGKPSHPSRLLLSLYLVQWTVAPGLLSQVRRVRFLHGVPTSESVVQIHGNGHKPERVAGSKHSAVDATLVLCPRHLTARMSARLADHEGAIPSVGTSSLRS